MRCLINSYCNRLNTNQIGGLVIEILDITNNLPISNALVEISKISYSGQFVDGAEGLVIAELYTNNNGIIHIDLPILNELMSNNAFYSAFIQKEKYHDAYIYYIQIYPNMNAYYTVHLSPASEEIKRFRFIFQPTTRRVHEH